MVDRAVRMVMAEAPDLVVLGGDYVTWRDRRFVAPAADALAPLSAPARCLRGAGQPRRRPRHAGGAERERLRRAARRADASDDPRRNARSSQGSDSGPAACRTSRHVLRGASPNVMLLAHTPKRLVEAAALAVPLVLSGHTHGGQIVLPVDRGRRRARVSRHRRHGQARQHGNLREPGRRHGVRPGAPQLPPRSRDPDASTRPKYSREFLVGQEHR